MAKIKKGCVDDLATLSELNEEIILEELQARYNQDVIYVRELYPLEFECRLSWWHMILWDNNFVCMLTFLYFLVLVNS